MEFSSFHQVEITLCGLLLLLLLLLLISVIFLWRSVKDRAKENTIKNYKTLLEPEGSWPLIGHLLLLQHQLPHRTLAALADKCGPAFGIRLGVNRAFVVSNWAVAKECFTINDKVFSSRPMNFMVKAISYADLSLGFAPYGQHWREMRKMAMTQLLSVRRLEQRIDIFETEINSLLGDLYKKCVEQGGSTIVELSDRFRHFTMNIILRLIAGIRFEGTDEAKSGKYLKTFNDIGRLTGQFFISDAIPFLGWIDKVSGHVGEVKRLFKDLDDFLQRWVEEHRHNKIVGKIDGRKQDDFIDVMLSALDDGRPAAEVDAITKATTMILVGAGGDTTAITLTWVIALLLNNNHALKKAQDELDINVGNHHQVEESDINNLTYTKVIIKETLRLYPPAPLSVPRLAMEDCTVAGFHIPKGTQLLVNLWKLHRDPAIWKNPSEFIPERFLEEHAHWDFKGQDFEYLPFGSGRRVCPGITLASQVLHLTLARLLHAFELKTVSDKPMDMKEGAGLSLPKDTPLEVILTPRLPAKLYVDLEDKI